MPTARTLYRNELARCREHFERVDLQQERGYLMKFTTFSANVENVIPQIPRASHENLFRQVMQHEIYATLDQQSLSAGELVRLSGTGNLPEANEPAIYCAYHLGSYRLLTSVLFRRGVDCVLMVGSSMNRSQGDDMTRHIEGLRRQHGYTNAFRVVEAGSPTAALTVLRELKAGRSLIVYVDGSPESAPEPGEESQYLSVRLGNRRMLTRKGVAYLSHAAGVPLVPAISYREKDLTNVLHFQKAIRPIRKSDREMYCREAMQQLYDALWPYLLRYPEQWSGWNHIHSFLEPEKPCSVLGRKLGKPAFNADRYALCDMEQAPILFDRRLYQTYEITDDLRDLLLNLNGVESVEDVVGQDVFGELVELEVLY